MDDPHDLMMLRAKAAAEWRRRVDEDPSLALDEPATDHQTGLSRRLALLMVTLLLIAVSAVLKWS